MAAPVPLRPDYDAARLRGLARRSRDPDQTRRLLALAAIYGGGSRSEAAAVGGVGLQTVRDWVVIRQVASRLPTPCDRVRAALIALWEVAIGSAASS